MKAAPRLGPLAAVAAALVLGCSGEAEPPTAGQTLREGVDMVMYEMSTFVTREGVRRARLEADTAEFRSETEIHLRPVSLTFFDQGGRETTVITADYGIFYELTEDMEAQGSVVVIDRQDDQRLETERLRYVRAEDRLYGDVPFVLTSDGGRTRLEGRAFESDPGLDSFRVPSPTGSSERPLAPPPPETARATADEGEAPRTVVPDSAEDLTGAAPAGFPGDSVPATGDSASDTVPPASDTAAATSDTVPAASDTAPGTGDSLPVPADTSGARVDARTIAKR